MPQGLPAIAITQLCKQLRNEYLPLWMAQAQFHVIAKDVSRFLKTFCRTTMHADGTTPTLCPRAITILILDYGRENLSIDLLPLLELQSTATDLSITLGMEPVYTFTVRRSPRRPRARHERRPVVAHESITVSIRDISQLMKCDNETWLATTRSKQLSQVLPYPYASSSMTHIELVFHERYMGIPSRGFIMRCYLPELRCLGLEGVYRTTVSLSMGARLTAKAADAENEDWDQYMLQEWDFETSAAGEGVMEPHVEDSDGELADDFLLAWAGYPILRR